MILQHDRRELVTYLVLPASIMPFFSHVKEVHVLTSSRSRFKNGEGNASQELRDIEMANAPHSGLCEVKSTFED